MFKRISKLVASLIAWIFGHRPQPPPRPCNCGECPSDPAFACSYTGKDVTVLTAYVANAYRGDLFLCPGGSMGPIGGLLHQLDPPQHYSHMGIFVADYDLVRHCTTSEERLNAKEYYTGSILGQTVPENGLTPEHLEFGWPGTITQSVLQAFYADRYGNSVPGLASPYLGSNIVDKDSPKQPKSSYLINALSFDSVFDAGKWYPPLIVKPCPLLQTSEVTRALQRVADEALNLYMYYSFYAYTVGYGAQTSDFAGPQFVLPAPLPPWDAMTNAWPDWVSSSWQKAAVPVPTLPGCCSSFVWQAVQNANKSGQPQIVLDWAQNPQDALGEVSGGCVRAVPPPPAWAGDVTDADTPDGLYLYSQAERQIAGQWLHDSISQQVWQNALSTLQDSQPVLASALDDLGRAGFIAAALGGADAVAAVLGPFAPTADLTAALIEQLIELFYDLPDDLANQICNAFAFGCINGGPGDSRCVDADGNIITSVDSTNWSNAAGPGRTVSPDDIHMFWDAPGPPSGRKLQGLYGYNEPAVLCFGYYSRPTCELVPSTGTVKVVGIVEHNGKAVSGAYVTAGCQLTISSAPRGEFEFELASGPNYKLIARYYDPATRTVLYGEKTTGITQPGSLPLLTIKLLDPPDFMRNVVISGWIRVDDVNFTGADNADNYFSTTLFLQSGVAIFDETSGMWAIDTSQQILTRERSENAEVGDSNGKLTFTATLDPTTLSVDVTVLGQLNPGPGGDNISQTHNLNDIPAGQAAPTQLAEFDLDNGDTFPDRAYFRNITIANLPAQGY